MSDVATAANVSAITVSRVLRMPQAVSQNLRERVERAIREIGYVPNSAAQALASASSDVVGVIIPSVANAVYSDVLRGVYEAVENTRFQIQLGNSNYSYLQEENLLRIFLGQRPAALLITGFGQSRESMKLLQAMNCPIVQIMEIGPDPIDMQVGFSHEDACEAAIRNLIDRSYRRIGFLAGQMDRRAQIRLRSYERTMRAAGLFDERLIVTTTKATTVTMGGELCAELLARAPDADALQANNDDIAIGALFECQRRRMRIPEDFGISGFNDLEIAAAAHPRITSVKTYRYEMGRRAVQMLMDAVAGKRPEQQVVNLGFKLIERESTMRPPASPA